LLLGDARALNPRAPPTATLAYDFGPENPIFSFPLILSLAIALQPEEGVRPFKTHASEGELNHSAGARAGLRKTDRDLWIAGLKQVSSAADIAGGGRP
jgi:hypothetical protein